MNNRGNRETYAERLAKPLAEFKNHLLTMCAELAEHEKLLPPGSLEKFSKSLRNVNASLKQLCEEFERCSIEQKKRLPPPKE
jgi:hypothetical protein